MRGAWLGVAAFCWVAGVTYDAPTAEVDRRSEARRLFNEGIDLRDAGDLPHALGKFESADAAFATPKTRLELARTCIALGRLVRGLELLRLVSSIPFDPKDATKYEAALKDAVALAAKTEPRLAHVRIERGSDVEHVSIDGERVASSALTAPIAMDPGPHLVSARVSGVDKIERLDLSEGSTAVLHFGRDPTPTGASAGESRPSRLATALFVTSGVGIVAGTVLAFSAKSSRDASESNCNIGGVPDACNDEGLGQRHSAGVKADWATAAFTIGIAAAGAGVAVWLLEPKTSTTSARVELGLGSIRIMGAF